MTDDSQIPAGWYPDPDRADGQRWWNGMTWTDDRRGGIAAPTPPAAAPASVAANAASGYPAYPTYGGYSSAPAAEPVAPRDVPTNTVWIWLIVFLPVLSVLPLFFFDWEGYLRDVVVETAQIGSGSSPLGPSPVETGLFAFSALSYVVVALQVLFAWLDWRALRARGIVRPFHWAWIFFTLVVSNGVYVIGRGVVLRRQTGRGLGPVWAWIAVTVAGFAAGIIFTVYLMNFVFTVLVPYLDQIPTT
ncbi:DUF2510 domain-containing protein [Microbacterium sp. NPDC091313]